MDRRLDPRSIVTPYAFAVHPDLLGMPLATPWQRLGAILVDLIIIGFISQVGLGPLAIASGLLLFWMATRKKGRDIVGRMFRIAVGCLGLSVLAGSVVVILAARHWDQIQDFAEEFTTESVVEETVASEPAEGPPGLELGLMGAVEGFRGAMDIRRAETRDEAQTSMDEFAKSAYAGGISRSQIREIMTDLIPEDADWTNEGEEMVEIAISALDDSSVAEEPTVQEGTPGSEPTIVFPPEAEDSIAALEDAVVRAVQEQEDLSRALARTQATLEAERSHGPLAWLWSIIDELGIGFGWAALYLTITHAWWRGTSIGKKLFRIRVVMIDQRPLNWWLSFERAGGYAAGFATGLLGFAQIFWDPNRQAIHDKVSETIVIQEGKKPIPGPWIEEGRTQWQRGRSASGSAATGTAPS